MAPTNRSVGAQNATAEQVFEAKVNVGNDFFISMLYDR
jgi:hypothetical protein